MFNLKKIGNIALILLTLNGNLAFTPIAFARTAKQPSVQSTKSVNNSFKLLTWATQELPSYFKANIQQELKNSFTHGEVINTQDLEAVKRAVVFSSSGGYDINILLEV